jgi:hypothetical protein
MEKKYTETQVIAALQAAWDTVETSARMKVISQTEAGGNRRGIMRAANAFDAELAARFISYTGK